MSVELLVDGQAVVGEANELLIDILLRRDAKVPCVCYHQQLGPIETCDTCLVEINGELARACATRVSAGMIVQTKTPRADAAQREAFDRLLKDHMLYCTVCDNNNGNCTIHNTTKMLGVEHQKYPFKAKPYEVDESNPFLPLRPEPMRALRALRGGLPERGGERDAFHQLGRSESACALGRRQADRRVELRFLRPLRDSLPLQRADGKIDARQGGYMSGLPKQVLNPMIDIIKGIEPDMGYGSILKVSEAESAMRESRTRKTKTVCTYCGVGCSFEVWTRGRHILKVRPNDGPTNGISTCIKGKFGWDFVNSEERLTSPLIRENGEFRKATWDEALDLIARRFTEIKKQHGPDALAFISSSKCTNEESYLMQKLARAVIGTNNMDNCSRYCQAPATTGLFRTVGYGGDSGSIRDIENAGLVLIIGSNTAEAHPVLATRVKQAHKLRGQKLIVADLRKHEMAERADLFFSPTPGSDLVWISAITKYILDSGLEHKEFIAKWVNGLDDYKKSLEPFTLEFAAQKTGLSVDLLKQVAHMIVEASGVCVLWAMGITQHSMGSDTSTAISNLLLVTGNYMRTGTGAYPLRGHNNVQGAGDHGAHPKNLPGYQDVDDPEVRGRFEARWNVKLPTTRGLDNHEMIDANPRWQAQVDVPLRRGNRAGRFQRQRRAGRPVQAGILRRAGHFLQQVLPIRRRRPARLPAACPSLEKEGTFTSTERRIQRLYQVLEPLEGSRPDWIIIRDVANRLGANWSYSHPSEIYKEIAALTPMFAGVTYERLEGFKSLQWPVAADGTDQPLLYLKEFAVPGQGGKALLYPLKYTAPTEPQDAEFDLHLNNGRMLEHFHEGNMTYKANGIREKVPDTFLEISPELAKERGVQSGTWVQLISPPRQGARAGAGHRPRARQGTLHADELLRAPGQSPHQQQHRRGHAHAGVQGDSRAHGGAGRHRRQSPAPRQFALPSSHAANGSAGRAQMEADRLRDAEG